MPILQSKRTVVMQSTLQASSVATLFVTLDASFKTDAAAVTTFDDASAGSDERTRYRLKFVAHTGVDIGEITLRLIAKGDVGQDDVEVVKSLAREEIEPHAAAATVTLLVTPTASFERVWKQAALDREGRESIDHLCALDVRVRPAAGHVVQQTVSAQDDDQLVLDYTWTDAAGTPVIAGKVVLDTAASAGADHRLGRIRVTDNDPTTGEDRFG